MRVTRSSEDLQQALQHPNVQAWLRLVRLGETHPDDDDAYHALYGWRPGSAENRFTSLLTHPRTPRKSPWGWTSAAGAYQAMAEVQGYVKTDTWGECCRWFDERDYVLTFSAHDQDLFAAWCTARRGALEDVLAGRIRRAMYLCRQEWASLPDSEHGQPTRAAEALLAVYRRYGGALADETTPAAPAQPEGKPMTPIIAAAIPALIQAAPQLIRVLGDGKVTERNAQAAEVVAAVAREVSAQPTTEGAVQAIEAQPQVAAQFREAIHQKSPELMSLVQAHGLDESSRQAALDRNLELSKATGGRWLYLLGAAAAIVLIASYVIVGLVLFRDGFSDETRAMLLGQVVVMGFASVVGWMFGSNISNRVGQQQRVERG